MSEARKITARTKETFYLLTGYAENQVTITGYDCSASGSGLRSFGESKGAPVEATKLDAAIAANLKELGYGR